MDCPDEAQLAAFLDRAVPDPTEIEAHIDTCPSCRETIACVAAMADETPRQLGRYRLDRVLGRGGMGVVWEAWDPSLERRIAIKVLRPEATDAASTARLVREARALAKLQHPNVVAVYDVGDVAGEVFIATELVDGQSMDRWQHGRTPAEIIAAYAQAARGLAAAHAIGLVHRDVKPSNILVSRDGRVRVGDFGLAVADRSEPSAPTTSQSRLTEVGAVVGTPAYMAPEQRAGREVDARADQYSLCLALVEALTGKRPEPANSEDTEAFAGTAVADPTPKHVGTEAFAGTQAAGPTTPGRKGADDKREAAGAIEATAVADPAASAPTTNPLPVRASSPPSRASRSRIGVPFAVKGIDAPWEALARGLAVDPADRFPDLAPLIAALDGRPARRRQWWPLVGVIVVALGLAAVVRLRGGGPACDEAVLAGVWGPAQAQALRDKFAASKLAYAPAAADATVHAIDAWAAELGREDRAACLTDDGPRAACVAGARAQLVDFLADLAEPDATTIQRAPPTARELPAPSACATSRVVALDPVAALRSQALERRVMRAYTLRHLGKLRESRALSEATVAEARAADTLPVLADAEHELGTVLHAQNDDKGAELALEEALSIAEKAHADQRAASIAALLVEIVGHSGDVEAAERQARIARSALARIGEDKYLEGVIERGLGRANRAKHTYAAAIEHYKRAEELHASLGLSDDVAFDQRAQVGALGNLERFDEAAALVRRLLATDREMLGPEHPSTLEDLVDAAQLQARAGRLAEAADELAKVVPVEERVYGADSMDVASLRARLAGVDVALGRIDDAASLFTKAVDTASHALPPGDEELRGMRNGLAVVEILRGHYAEGEAQLITLIDLARPTNADDELGQLLQNLADTYVRDGKLDLAKSTVREALEHDAKAFGAISRQGAEARTTLGNALAGSGDAKGAEAEYKRAIADFEKVVGPHTPELGEPLTGLGELVLARNDAATATPLFARAIEVLAAGDPVDLARARFAHARATNSRDEANTALATYRDAGERAAKQRTDVEKWLAAHPAK